MFTLKGDICDAFKHQQQQYGCSSNASTAHKWSNDGTLMGGECTFYNVATRGHGRVQIIENKSRRVFDGARQEGQMLIIPHFMEGTKSDATVARCLWVDFEHPPLYEAITGNELSRPNIVHLEGSGKPFGFCMLITGAGGGWRGPGLGAQFTDQQQIISSCAHIYFVRAFHELINWNDGPYHQQIYGHKRLSYHFPHRNTTSLANSHDYFSRLLGFVGAGAGAGVTFLEGGFAGSLYIYVKVPQGSDQGVHLILWVHPLDRARVCCGAPRSHLVCLRANPNLHLVRGVPRVHEPDNPTISLID
eukprot:Gb_29437 [translate_table: standard]